MPRSPKPAMAEDVSLVGLTGAEIAALISSGEVTQQFAEEFVSQRAIGKLQRELDKQAS